MKTEIIEHGITAYRVTTYTVGVDELPDYSLSHEERFLRQLAYWQEASRHYFGLAGLHVDPLSIEEVMDGDTHVRRIAGAHFEHQSVGWYGWQILDSARRAEEAIRRGDAAMAAWHANALGKYTTEAMMKYGCDVEANALDGQRRKRQVVEGNRRRGKEQKAWHSEACRLAKGVWALDRKLSAEAVARSIAPKLSKARKPGTVAKVIAKVRPSK